MFKMFKKNNVQPLEQKFYAVRFIHRYKVCKNFVEEVEIKAFSTEEKAIAFIESRGLSKGEGRYFSSCWLKEVKKDRDGYQAYIHKLIIDQIEGK